MVSLSAYVAEYVRIATTGAVLAIISIGEVQFSFVAHVVTVHTSARQPPEPCYILFSFLCYTHSEYFLSDRLHEKKITTYCHLTIYRDLLRLFSFSHIFSNKTRISIHIPNGWSLLAIHLLVCLILNFLNE